jgi:cobalt-zinc-cadmium efflux system outer membrane protein
MPSGADSTPSSFDTQGYFSVLSSFLMSPVRREKQDHIVSRNSPLTDSKECQLMLKHITCYLIAFLAVGQSIAVAQLNEVLSIVTPVASTPPSSRQNASTADTSYSVEAFLDEVLQNNPRLQAYRTRIQSSEARVPQATAWEDPQAAVEFFATPVTSANPFRDGMETDYSLQQTIPLFGQQSLMGDVAKANARMTEQSAAAIERNLIAEAKRGYAMLYSAQRRLVVNEENQRLLKQIIESARAKYSVGLTSQGDVLKVQVELAKLQNDRATLREEWTGTEAMMNALRSRPSNVPIGQVANTLPTEFKGTLEALLERSLADRPEIRAMRYEIQMNNAEVAVAKRMWFPELMLRGMYKDMKEGTDQWAAMIGITIPLAPWGIGKYSGKIEETELNVRSSELSLVDMQNMVRAEVSDAYAKVQSRWQQIERYQQTILPQSEQSLQSTLAGYQTDTVDFLSLLDTYRLVQMFKMEYYMVVGEYYGSLAALERAIGGDLR